MRRGVLWLVGLATTLLALAASSGAASPTVEVHWDTLNGSRFTRAGDFTSDFSPADTPNGVFELVPTTTGTPELGFIKLRGTGSGTVEVHVDAQSAGSYKRILSGRVASRSTSTR